MSACSHVKEHVNNLSTGLGAERDRRKAKGEMQTVVHRFWNSPRPEPWVQHDWVMIKTQNLLTLRQELKATNSEDFRVWNEAFKNRITEETHQSECFNETTKGFHCIKQHLRPPFFLLGEYWGCSNSLEVSVMLLKYPGDLEHVNVSVPYGAQ